MSGIWILAVCVGVLCSATPSSAQDSSNMRTLYLISGPEVLHGGIPIPLGVTVLTDSPVRVTAQVTLGKTSLALAEDTFQGGVTGVLTLPPIPGDSLTQSSLFTLAVRGYRGNELLFANITALSFNLRSVSTFIQTDRSRYRPEDTVRVRVASVQLDNRPYKGPVDISIQDPGGNIVQRWDSAGSHLGIVSTEFNLSQTASVGRWAITTTVNGMSDEKAFIVEHSEPHLFELLVKTAAKVLVGDDISGTVRALHRGGQPIHGSTQFFFSKDQLPALHQYSSSGMGDDGHVVVQITASITEIKTGLEVNRTVEVQVMENAFRLTFYNFPQVLKPSLHFSTKLSISRFDGRPLSSSELLNPVLVEVTQRTSQMDAEPTKLTLAVPEDGNIHIEFTLQDGVVMLFIHAKYMSSEETLELHSNYSSPSGSYIQILPVNAVPAQIGLPLEIGVESTFQPSELHYVVSSRGQVVAAGTKNSSSFSLAPTMSWSPEACITVYCVLPDGEVTSDTAHLPIQQHNYVSLNWSSDKAKPGDQVSLTVTVTEPASQVGILVMEVDDSAPEVDQDFTVEKECNIMVLTNARLYKAKQPDEPKKDALMPEKYWRHWMDQAATDSWLWLDTNVSDSTWTSPTVTVPDSITSWRAVALVMSENRGLGFTPVPQRLTVSKDFFLSVDVPSYLIRGEEIVLEVNVFNHLDRDLEVILLVAQSDAFEFVLADRGDISVVNAWKLTAGSQDAASALFPIRPLALGEMEISVDAISAEASDSLLRTALVKPEGVEQSYSKTLFLELAPHMRNDSRDVSFSFPPDVVPGSQRAHVAVVGENLGLSINSLDLLVQMPDGCGEQNMIHFAPSVYVVQYLSNYPQDHEEIRSRALGYMMEGYQRELSYQRDDGSFSAFGASDTSGSTWLTAFVLRCFLQAQPFMQVDQSVLSRASSWLLSHQGPEGEFDEVGRVIHTELQGGLDDGPVALTAYVLIALLEDHTYVDIPDNVSLAKKYLENRVPGGVVSNYSLCLVVYALTLANSPVAETALAELNRRAENKGGVKMWRSSDGLEPDEGQLHAAQIEMVSYVLLALHKNFRFVEAFVLLKWLSKQRNHLGGFGTTQDTVVALQALSYYAVFSGADAIDLRLRMSIPTSNSVSHLSINSSTYLVYQRQEIDAEKDLHIDIYMEGRGYTLFQMNVFYNLESRSLSQGLQHATDHEAFSLDVDVFDHERDHNHMLLSICTRLKENQVISQTGMVMVDVGMLSGFTLAPRATAPGVLIRKVETSPGKVSLYLDSLTKSEVCIRLPLIREYRVAHVQDAVVQVYDYYEPKRRAIRTYNSDIIHNMDSCAFCGTDCSRCMAGISISVSSTFLSHSTSSATYSLG
ncbi:CD109 antigen-like, partial [Centroberyx affinis]|uniref:CD109 antigen-like n=1 Tax=Centroberyx affinis TaxID=166261 RepID=UPI003A5BE2DD